MTAMSIDMIMERLPHRYPFLLIDRIVELKRGESITALKNVTINEPQFMGHFPGHPVMPGVLIVEAMAQAGGVLAFASLDDDEGDYLVYFTGIDGVRFRRPVRPGDQLIFKMQVLRHRGLMWKLQGEAYVGDELACSGTLMATLMPREQA